jgi:hypothetical protein
LEGYMAHYERKEHCLREAYKAAVSCRGHLRAQSGYFPGHLCPSTCRALS